MNEDPRRPGPFAGLCVLPALALGVVLALVAGLGFEPWRDPDGDETPAAPACADPSCPLHHDHDDPLYRSHRPVTDAPLPPPPPPAAVVAGAAAGPVDAAAAALYYLRASAVFELVFYRQGHSRYREWIGRATAATTTNELMDLLKEMGAL